MAEPWPDLPLDAWRDTRDTLHMCTQIAGKVRLTLAPPEPLWAHVALYVTARGLTTSPIPYGDRVFQIDFDLIGHEVVIADSNGSRLAIPLVPRPVSAFYADLMAGLASFGIDVSITARPDEVPVRIPFAEDDTHASYDPIWANRFLQVLVRVDAVMKEYRAGCGGEMSPVHFFWGTFDHALTRSGADRISACGFWTGSEGLAEPAFYAFTSPKPDGLESSAVRPEAAFWSTELGEFVLRYGDVRTSASPREDVLAFFESADAAGRALDD
jgi:hypothetical protein